VSALPRGRAASLGYGYRSHRSPRQTPPRLPVQLTQEEFATAGLRHRSPMAWSRTSGPGFGFFPSFRPFRRCTVGAGPEPWPFTLGGRRKRAPLLDPGFLLRRFHGAAIGEGQVLTARRVATHTLVAAIDWPSVSQGFSVCPAWWGEEASRQRDHCLDASSPPRPFTSRPVTFL